MEMRPPFSSIEPISTQSFQSKKLCIVSKVTSQLVVIAVGSVGRRAEMREDNAEYYTLLPII